MSEQSSKTYRHFADAATVHALVDEIKSRHQRSYYQIKDEIIEQIKSYFAESFPRDSNPSRFNKVEDNLVAERFLIGLSGGIDSSVVTYLAVAAVGREQILPITMPARPGDESVAAANLVRRELGFDQSTAAPYFIDIEPIVQAHIAVMTALNRPQIGLSTDHRAQNLEQKMRSGNFGSRVRIAVLSDLQRAIRGRILGTVNRTEFCQGYSTKFGTPISYDFGVLNELYKIDIYELGKVLGVPQQILTTPPSTGYFEGQTHEGELGATIEEQDIFAYLLFEKMLTPAQIAEQYQASEAFAKVIKHRFDVSEHKRVLNKLQAQAHISRVPLLA